MSDPLALIRDGKLAERTVPVCLAGDLVAGLEELERQRLHAARDYADSLGGGPAAAIARQMDEVRARMAEHSVVFRLRALPRPKFNDLKRAHPPRKGEDGAVDLADVPLGVNRDAFFDPLLRVSIVDPVLDEETYRLLVDERLTDAQFEHLTDVAWALNVRRVDVPFSPAASPTTPDSEPE